MTDLNQVGVQVSTTQGAKLQFLAERKYNRYDLYAPGETFESRLIDWLLNFEKEDRQTAMDIVWALTYVSQQEMRAIATATFRNITEVVASEITGLPTGSAEAFLDSRREKLDFELSKCLFIAMADDILFDFFRRHAQMSSASLTKDNFVEYYKLDRNLRNDLVEHTRVFLVDQVSASGFTVLRKDEAWEGKLPTFGRLWPREIQECSLYYCPYIIASRAERHFAAHLSEWARDMGMKRPPAICPTCHVSLSKCLRSGESLDIDPSAPVSRLCCKYHPLFVVDEHMAKGGPCQYGFGSAGLTLVLSTNCPNDTLPIVWHSFNGWKPLFPRVRHHR